MNSYEYHLMRSWGSNPAFIYHLWFLCEFFFTPLQNINKNVPFTRSQKKIPSKKIKKYTAKKPIVVIPKNSLKGSRNFLWISTRHFVTFLAIIFSIVTRKNFKLKQTTKELFIFIHFLIALFYALHPRNFVDKKDKRKVKEKIK